LDNIAERYVLVIKDFEKLVSRKANKQEISEITSSSYGGRLAVNNSERRLKAGLLIRKKLKNETFELEIQKWADAIYEIPDTSQKVDPRVWITPGGQKYHDSRDCKGFSDGQNYAIAKGKEIYKPEFVTLKHAAFVLDKKPCDICKPIKWKN
jgi:hypothetical protein